MAQLFSQPLLKVYRAPVLSCSFIFCFFLFMVAVVLPFFLAFSTYDFWKERGIYNEQPQVLYRKELIVMVYSETLSVSGTSIVTTPSTQVFSTLGALNSMYFESLSPMLIRSSLLDYNFDDYPDMYDFNITVYTAGANVKNVKVLSFYDYRIRSRIKMDMVSLAYADVDTPSGASNVYIDGNLEFYQSQPLKTSTIVRTEYNTSVLNFDSVAENYLPLLLLRYKDRNTTTTYNYQSLVVPMAETDKLTVSMKVRVPANQVYEYQPGFLEVMKFAWIQYLSLLIPVGYLIYRFAGFIYRNQILECHISYESKVKTTG